MGGIIKKTILNSALLLILVVLTCNKVEAQTVPLTESSEPVFLITELKVSPSTEEFIEFTNNTNQELEISSVKLEYHSDTSTNYSNKTLTFKKELPLPISAGSKLQLSSATSNWVNDSLATFSAGLKDSTGWIKLSVTVGNTVYSSSAHWGIKDEPNCATSPAPGTPRPAVHGWRARQASGPAHGRRPSGPASAAASPRPGRSSGHTGPGRPRSRSPAPGLP